MINRIIMIIMALGAVAGGIDRIMGNRFGYGKKFEEGFQYLGPTALSMVGIICLAPLVSGTLGKLIIPVYRFLGVDPAMFGSLLAIDMGGYQLSMELAENPMIGRDAGGFRVWLYDCFYCSGGDGSDRRERQDCICQRNHAGAGSHAGGADCRRGCVRPGVLGDSSSESSCSGSGTFVGNWSVPCPRWHGEGV